MRRVVLLTLLALALPTAALANSVDFNLNGGSVAVTSSSVTISTFVTAFSWCNTICGSPSSTTGTVSISLPSFTASASGSFGTGGTISINSGSYVFNGTFTSGNWTVVKSGRTGKDTEYIFSGIATGTLWINGVETQTKLNIASGQTILSNACLAGHCAFASGDITINTVPEPGTLGLLGTGLLGLAGLVRRRMRS